MYLICKLGSMHSYMCVDICLYECYVGQRSSLNSVLGYLHLSVFVVVVGDDLIWIGFTDQTKSRFCDMLLLVMELAALTGYLGVYFPHSHSQHYLGSREQTQVLILGRCFSKEAILPTHESWFSNVMFQRSLYYCFIFKGFNFPSMNVYQTTVWRSKYSCQSIILLLIVWEFYKVAYY